MRFDGKSESVFLRMRAAGEIEIDSAGRVWRLKLRRYSPVSGKTELRPCKRIRMEHTDRAGYLQVRVSILGVRYIASAHRLVYRACVGEIPAGLTINHRNGRKPDNRPANLELATFTEQALHSFRVLGKVNVHGESHPNAKLTASQALEIRTRRNVAGEELSAIAADFGIAFQTVSKIAHGKAWAHVGANA